MRTVSNTLAAAQSATSARTPFIYLLFTSYDEGTTVDLSKNSATYGNRILLIDHLEGLFDGYATIILLNNDRLIPDLIGYSVDIGYGDTLVGGNEYIGDGTSEGGAPRMWVKSQQTVSAAGKLWTVLILEGGWRKMGETQVLPGGLPATPTTIAEGATPIDFTTYTATTIYDIIDYFMQAVGFTLATLSEDDSIIDTLEPEFTVNDTQPFENVAGVVYRLLRMTKSFIRWHADTMKQAEIKYPQSANTADFTVYSYQAQYFKEFVEQENVLIPNHILVYCNAGTNGLYENIILGEATDATSIAQYGTVYGVHIVPEIDNQTDADARADSLLVRAKAEQDAGILIMNHDCRIQLLDRPAIYDARGN